MARFSCPLFSAQHHTLRQSAARQPAVACRLRGILSIDRFAPRRRKQNVMKKHCLLHWQLLLAMLLSSGLAGAQAAPWIDDPPATSVVPMQVLSERDGKAVQHETMAPTVVTATDPSTVTIP